MPANWNNYDVTPMTPRGFQPVPLGGYGGYGGYTPAPVGGYSQPNLGGGDWLNYFPLMMGGGLAALYPLANALGLFTSPQQRALQEIGGIPPNVRNISDLSRSMGYTPLTADQLRQAVNAVYGSQVGQAQSAARQRALASGIYGAPAEALVQQTRTPIDVARLGQEISIMQAADESQRAAAQMVMSLLEQQIRAKACGAQGMSSSSPFGDIMALLQTGLQIAPFILPFL